MLDVKQFAELIVQPSLRSIDSYSLSAELLLLGTCSHESRFGTYLKQINGSALGIYGTRHNIHDDIIKWSMNIEIWPKILSFLGNNFSAYRMIYDLNYATVIARLIYLKVEEPLPSHIDMKTLAIYWKKYYSAEQDKSTEEDFMRNWILYGL